MDFTIGYLDLGQAGPARIGSGRPEQFRFAQYPDGSVRLQGGYSWVAADNSCAGMDWREIPTVLVDAKGKEIPKPPSGWEPGMPGTVLVKGENGKVTPAHESQASQDAAGRFDKFDK